MYALRDESSVRKTGEMSRSSSHLIRTSTAPSPPRGRRATKQSIKTKTQLLRPRLRV